METVVPTHNFEHIMGVRFPKDRLASAVVQSYRLNILRSYLAACPKGNRIFLTACCKEATAISPFRLPALIVQGAQS